MDVPAVNYVTSPQFLPAKDGDRPLRVQTKGHLPVAMGRGRPRLSTERLLHSLRGRDARTRWSRRLRRPA